MYCIPYKQLFDSGSIGVRFEFDSVQFSRYFYRTKFKFDSNLRQIRIELPLQIEPKLNPNLTRTRTKIEIDTMRVEFE